MELSTRVKELCKQRNIQLKDLAAKMNIAPESLTRTLRGNPQLSTLNNIADALNIEISELFNQQSTTLQAIIIYKEKTYTANNLNELKSIVKELTKNL